MSATIEKKRLTLPSGLRSHFTSIVAYTVAPSFRMKRLSILYPSISPRMTRSKSATFSARSSGCVNSAHVFSTSSSRG
jgi:hypothetical protein